MAGPSLRTYAITGNEAQHGAKQINKIITDNSNTYVNLQYIIFLRGRDEEEKLRHQLSDPEGERDAVYSPYLKLVLQSY
jgi:hypothetical protein